MNLIMRLKLTILFFIPFLATAQEGVPWLDCNYTVVKTSDSTYKVQVMNYDSVSEAESCFLMWMNSGVDKPDGKLYVYDADGNIRRMANYQSGSRAGKHLTWYATGELESETIWETDLYFTDRYFYKSGKIKSTSENGNRANAVYTTYYENGQMEARYGEGDKVQRGWHENGQLKLEIREEAYTEWYPNGNKKMSGKLKNTLNRVGKWTYFNEEGKRIRVLWYGKGDRAWYGDETGYLKEKKYNR
jgi:antitoxin component YwqK of YwqJK toxin-antitoxin module